MGEETTASLSIYRAARTIKRKDNSLYNALSSIYQDSVFVGEIALLWPELPLVANLRCGLWYSPPSAFRSHCYFKSTDGHTNNLSFNASRLNLHLALLAGREGGCIVVDSTRKGKRFPDSMSKTIPVWTCLLNRVVRDRKAKSKEWDCSLHLPLWVSKTEKASIERRLDEWTTQLEESGADIASLDACLRKPLRPLWISQRSLIWLNQLPDLASWDFTPIILVSASRSTGFAQIKTASEHSWSYIAGAGDDEESWARGLSPALFWNHVYDLISSSPDSCNQMVADIVEKDRVCRVRRGQSAPQVTLKPAKLVDNSSRLSDSASVGYEQRSYDNHCGISWVGSTNLAVGSVLTAVESSDADCIINCDKESIAVVFPDREAYLHLPVLTSKFDRFSLLKNLPHAVDFAKANLSKGKRILVCCCNGEDISICVCLAILISLFDDEGNFDGGKSLSRNPISKWEIKRRLVVVCKFTASARPSRGNLKQVFNFLNGRRASSEAKCNAIGLEDVAQTETLKKTTTY